MAAASHSTRRTRSPTRPPDPRGEPVRTLGSGIGGCRRALAHRTGTRDEEPALAGRLLADRGCSPRRLPALRALGARRLGAFRAAGLQLADPARRGRRSHDDALRTLATARRGAV